MRVNILAIGKNRQGVFRELYDFYVKRIQWDIQLIEFETQKTQNWKKQRLEETKKLVSSVPKGSPVIILDETGKLVSSKEFSGWIGEQLDNGARNISFLIGGSYGLDPSAINSSDLVFSFGRVTWPHLMIRGMVAEQLYRAQQILKNHPYHRD